MCIPLLLLTTGLRLIRYDSQTKVALKAMTGQVRDEFLADLDTTLLFSLKVSKATGQEDQHFAQYAIECRRSYKGQPRLTCRRRSGSEATGTNFERICTVY